MSGDKVIGRAYHRSLKRNLLAFSLLAVLSVGLILIAQVSSWKRTVHGRVVTSDGEELAGAVVQLEDSRTLWIRSYISEKHGEYHFSGLNPDIDYEIVARFRGRSSPKQRISHFDERHIIELQLAISEEPRP